MAESAFRRRLFREMTFVVAGLLYALHMSAQAPLPVSRIQLAVSSSHDILILGRPSRTMIRVQATDPQGRPVRRAIVVFVILPSAGGAGALFATGGLSETVVTDDQGVAQVVIERATGGTGEFKVEVKASFEGAIAEPAQITLRNVRLPTPVTKWVALGAVGGGVGVAAALLAGRGDNKPVISDQVRRTRIIEGPGTVR